MSYNIMMGELIPRYLFDLEGTLVNLEEIHRKAFEEVAHKLGIVFGKDEFRQFVGAGDAAISKAIAELVDSKNIDANSIREAKKAVYKDMLRSNDIKARDGVENYLKQSQVLSGDLVIASITPREDAETILTRTGLKPFFKYVLTEESVSHIKPNPEVYLIAANMVDAKPNGFIVHEDSPPGVSAGISAKGLVAAFPVHDNLVFDPRPHALYLSWIGVNPEEVWEKCLNSAEHNGQELV